jgi:radical SAM superfamily enzyme YgiQ (UPF0313 family)
VWLVDRVGPAPDRLRVALAYPASYEVAMSSLGFHAALAALLEHPGVSCERAFLDPPLVDAGTSYESGTPLSEFDVVAFSVSFEADYLGLASLLHAGGIPLQAIDRSEDDPLVVMGGVCASLNPEPIAAFVDAALVGDAGALVPGFAASVASSRGRGRADRLRELSRVQGAYVPALYGVERSAAGGIVEFSSPAGAPLPVRPALDPPGTPPAASVVLSSGAHFEDMHLVEMSRGCAWDCRFCAAGHVYHPARFHPATDVVAAAARGLRHTKRVGLVSAALVDHPQSSEILARLMDLGAEVNVSSLRMERIDEEAAGLLAAAGVKTVTVAPETGRADLRAIVGKTVSDEEILAASRALARAGIETLRLYFMVGVPGETDDDVEAIAELTGEIRSAFTSGRPGVRVAVSASAFVPKPRTPFQWLPMADSRTIRRRIELLRRRLAAARIYRFSATGPREAFREGVLARGGRELAPAIALTAAGGTPFKAALRRTGVDARAIAERDRDEDEIFPWEIVDAGAPRERLLASLRTARSLIEGRSGG